MTAQAGAALTGSSCLFYKLIVTVALTGQAKAEAGIFSE